jgi:hypothetical protein
MRRFLAVALAAVLLTGCPWDSTKPKAATGLQIAGGNGQTVVAGVTLSTPPAVKAVTEDAAGVAGVVITWTVNSGDGSVAGTTSTTDAEGLALAPAWTIGKAAGTNTLTASAEAIQKSVTFLATGIAGPPAVLSVSAGGSQTSAASAPVGVLPAVRVTDANENAVAGASVTFAVTSGGGSVTGSVQGTNANGVATVGSWTLGPAAGANTLSATVAGVTTPATFTATATAAASQLVVNTQPTTAISGEAIDPAPVVSVRDAGNTVVTTAGTQVTASIASGSGTLGGTTTVSAVNGLATFSNLSVTGTSAVTLRFSASGLTAAVSNAFTPTPPPQLNLTIDRVHLNQSTQNYSGTVPIVAGRAALARVFVKANITNTATPAVRLSTFRNGTAFKTYTITSPGSFVPKTPDETILIWSWNYLIPADEVVDGMSVLAEVDPANAIVESSDSDNTYPASGTPLSLDVRQTSTMKVTFVPVSQPGVVAGNVNETNKNGLLDLANRLYPFDTTDVIVHAVFAYNRVLSSAYDSTWNNLLAQIAALRTTEAAPDRYYFGLAHPGYQSGGTGLGYIGQPAAIAMDFTSLVQPSTNYVNMTIAHEWGHNFGRNHVGCGMPSNPDGLYPYDALTSVGTLGYDKPNDVLRKANEHKDLMSYCQPVWISDYTYKAVLEYRATHPGPLSPRVSTLGVGSRPSAALLVWGRIARDGSVVFEPSYEIDAPPSLPTRPGRYTVQALDDSGRQMFAVSFAGDEIDHLPGERSFAYAIPLPSSGARPASLRIMNGARELARRTRAQPPAAGGATTNAVAAPTRLTSMGVSRSRLEWDAKTYPGAMVRDPATGQVLAFLSGGTGDINVAREVDVLFSTGVGSVKQRVTITPK